MQQPQDWPPTSGWHEISSAPAPAAKAASAAAEDVEGAVRITAKGHVRRAIVLDVCETSVGAPLQTGGANSATIGVV